MTNELLLTLIPVFPLVGFLILGLFRKWFPKDGAGILASAMVGLSFIASLALLFRVFIGNPDAESVSITLWNWMNTGKFTADFGLKLDQLSMVMALVVSGVSFIIHVYSIGYMKHDAGRVRYFTYLNLFVMMMLFLVLADNLILMFVGWEGVGLCSYLLIGFWFHDSQKAYAGRKAFVMNRIGDFGFILAIFMTWIYLGSVNFDVIVHGAAGLPVAIATVIALLFFLGATGKSAQIPLYPWLPDAMAGPTPVSALIHAATMVTAGVYMIVRLHPIYLMSPLAMNVVAGVGVATAFVAATIAFVQTDIKKVLAYSTVSQLGYMVTALGVGAFVAGMFHLMTHAFFKALLFMGSGSVIHAMQHAHHEKSQEYHQNIDNMGNLKQWMPSTHKTFVIGSLALAGIIPFAGFFSKDEILWHAFQTNTIVWIVGVVTALMTAFYTFRMVYKTFYGKPRMENPHLHESPKVMTIPLWILAVLSIIGGWIGLPHIFKISPNWFADFLNHVIHVPHAESEQFSAAAEWGTMGLSLGLAVFGIWFATFLYGRRNDILEKLKKPFTGYAKVLQNKYYVDWLYENVIGEALKGISKLAYKVGDRWIIEGLIGLLSGWTLSIGKGLAKLQTGKVAGYAAGIVIGALIIFIFLLLKGGAL